MCKGGAMYGGYCNTCRRGGLGGDEVTVKEGGKRKLSDYNKFVKKEFKNLKKQYPSKTAPEIMRLIAKKWKASKP